MRDPAILTGACAVAGLLLWCAGATPGGVWRQVRGLVWVLLAVAAFTAWFQGWREALAVLLRIAAMVGLALAVTLSTRSSDLIAVCERVLMPLQRIGLLDAGKVSLALAPVSYTHLDVYKRQAPTKTACNRSARSSRAAPASPNCSCLLYTSRCV